METKSCKICSKFYPIAEYPSGGLRNGKVYYKPFCKDCRNKKLKAKRRLVNPERYSPSRKIKCHRCEKHKEAKLFIKRKNSTGLDQTCNECKNDIKIIKANRKIIIPDYKKCQDCNTILSIDKFILYKESRKGDKYRTNSCRSCINKRVKLSPKYHDKLKYTPEKGKYMVKYMAKQREHLSDYYIKSLLIDDRNFELKWRDITPELIIIKRKQLLLKQKII